MSDKKNEKFQITPETKIAELLKHYPFLEETLIELAPVFSKLKNPVLRRTIAKVTSLKQAAKVGNLPLGEILNRLRADAGLETAESTDESVSDHKAPPAWFDNERIKIRFDARPIIDAGEQPLGSILAKLAELQTDEILELTASFTPEPIKDMARSKGFQAWSKMEDKNLVKTYFIKQE